MHTYIYVLLIYMYQLFYIRLFIYFLLFFWVKINVYNLLSAAKNKIEQILQQLSLKMHKIIF